MERKPYSAGAVKFSFWFMEFRKTVQLLSEGKSFADIKKLNEETNIYGAPTKLRAQQIYSTVTARIKTLDESFYPILVVIRKGQQQRRNLTWAGLIGWKRLMLRWMISDINAAWRVI